MKILKKLFSGPKYLNGIKTSRMTRILFVLFFAIFGIGLIGYFFDFMPLYGAAILVLIPLMPLLFIIHLLDQRRENRIEKQKYSASVRSCPPEFFQPAKAASTEIDTGSRYAAYDALTARYIGDIPARQLAELIRAEEEWGEESNDITILPETIDLLKEQGASPDLLKFLHRALGTDDEIELRWIKLRSQ